MIPAGGQEIFTMDVTVSVGGDYGGCQVNYVEHVEVRTTLSGGVRGALSIRMLSPAGKTFNRNII